MFIKLQVYTICEHTQFVNVGENMSADNGIYIAKFPDGYRVIYAMAIDNLSYYPQNSKEQLAEIKNYFQHVDLYNTEEAAILAAWEKSKNYDILEYGVSSLGELPYWE